MSSKVPFALFQCIVFIVIKTKKRASSNHLFFHFNQNKEWKNCRTVLNVATLFVIHDQKNSALAEKYTKLILNAYFIPLYFANFITGH